jgi:hypothetical protein
VSTPSPQPSTLTSLPSLDDLPRSEDGGYDVDAVRDAFEAFRRHAVQLQAQVRVLQAAGKGANLEPTGHAVRMDALHLIRAAAEFADVLERDAQNATAGQIQRTEAEVTRRQRELKEREREVDRYREDSERQRAEIINAAKNESREILATTNRDATAELREAEGRGARLLEQARHQATELTNSARAEVEQTLDWARAQSAAVLSRAQQAAEQLLTAAGLPPEQLAEVTDALLAAARADSGESSPQETVTAPPSAPVAAVPDAEDEAEAAEPEAETDVESAPEETGPAWPVAEPPVADADDAQDDDAS